MRMGVAVMTGTVFVFVLVGAGGLVFWLGRRFSPDTQRVRELDVVLENLRKDHECALAELEVARDEWKRAERERDQLRADLSDHLGGTAELLRGLARDYRAICDHVAQGAELLCPERAAAIEASLAPELPSGETPEPPAPLLGIAAETSLESPARA
jgi:hypothetical protein